MNEQVRTPDVPVTERLINNSYMQFESEEDQLKRALEESEVEFEIQQAIILSTLLQNQREARSKKFASIKPKFAQFMRIDKNNTEFYTDIIRYIEKYESGNLESVNVGEEFYGKFRRTLDNMRITATDKNNLLELIKQ
jgi:hypothetical protein